jgi:hypothetical protein
MAEIIAQYNDEVFELFKADIGINTVKLTFNLMK